MPLVYPLNGSSIASIVGIDPGTTNLGFAALDIDLTTEKLVAGFATSFQSQRMMRDDGFIRISHSERMEKIIAQKDNLVSMFRFYQPIVICCESPFYNRLRPSAFQPLVEIMAAIKTAAIEYNGLVKFITYAPSDVKKTIGANYIAGKDAVKLEIKSNAEIKALFPEGMLESLDEHAIDAIAVAYTHVKRYRSDIS